MLTRLLRLLFYIIAACAVTLAYTTTADAQETPALTAMVTQAASAHGIDPDLALAIMEVESGFNSKAVGSRGEIGLFQLRPEYHGEGAVFDEQTNVNAGVSYLATVYRPCLAKYGSAWFVCNNYGPNGRQLKDPKATNYYRKVITLYKERKKLRAKGQHRVGH